ncbi:alpha,alpha-phosphotrehalase [Mesoplasma syrphidae]|uniref:Alpha,alpha-phosphotrehalase n=1 Tax=Mesoplasma syrphidae TaxID=225999 RepID=A0A2K9BVJ8_9MOLU|nr:alpha-amylase family glycosyl hydrolase [Mesoplasma syrphidae]AUF83740.1 alpha,alpha-phosphotrehalase [Mesoplasma syrphidae]
MKNELIYEVFIPTFNDGLKTGRGNLQGVIKKLSYLKELGVTRIWLSPFYESPFKDSGYDVANYCQVNSDFGSLKDLELLIEKAKMLDISIITDIVFNHTSDQHKWFQKALQGDDKYMSYYIFKDPVNGKPPTNWKSKMGGSAWEFVPKLNKYYLHLFAKEQPDLNWQNLELRQELIKILNFWKDKGIKGFRLDVCNLYDKPLIFEDDQLGDGRKFYTDGPNIEKYFQLMNQEVFSKIEDCFTVGEVSSTTKEKSAKYAKDNNEQLDSVFTFLHLKVDYINNNKWTYSNPDLQMFWDLVKEWQEYYQEHHAELALFMNNHDQPRAVSRFGNIEKFWKESATAIFGFTALMKGIPFLYQGEEIGMSNLNLKNINEFVDVETIGHIPELLEKYSANNVLKILNSKARDNARSVMQWNENRFAGFTKNEKCSEYVNANYLTINVEKQNNDGNSILNHYKKIINLRKTLKPLYCGAIKFFEDLSYAYKRIYGNEEIWVLTNWSENYKTTQLKELPNQFQVIYNNTANFDIKKLSPYQLVILQKVTHEI